MKTVAGQRVCSITFFPPTDPFHAMVNKMRTSDENLRRATETRTPPSEACACAEDALSSTIAPSSDRSRPTERRASSDRQESNILLQSSASFDRDPIRSDPIRVKIPSCIRFHHRSVARDACDNALRCIHRRKAYELNTYVA